MTAVHPRTGTFLALIALLGGATACDSGTGSGGEERFTARVLSLNGGLAQRFYAGTPLTPRGSIVLTGDTATFSPYAAECRGVRVDGRVDLNRTNCEIIPAPPPASVRWSSSDPAVATVDASGRARAVAAGTATIRAEADGYVTDHAQVGFDPADLSAIRVVQVRQVERIVVTADSARRDGCVPGVCPVRVDVDPATQRLRMLPGDVSFFTVRQVVDTGGNDVLPEIDTRRGRFAWTSSGPGLAVSEPGVVGEGRVVATARGPNGVVVTAGGRSQVVPVEVGGLESVRVAGGSPSFSNGRFTVAVGQTATFDLEFVDSFGRAAGYVVQKGESVTNPALFSHARVPADSRYASRYSLTGRAPGEAALSLTFGFETDPSNLVFRAPVSVVP